MDFCTVVNCMDGRVQLPVNAFLRERFGAPFVDTVTEPGPNRILGAPDEADAALAESVLKRVDISVRKHGSRGIAVAGHHDCAGNPSPKQEQLRQLEAAVRLLRSRFPEAEVLGLWVDPDWRVSEAVAGRAG